MPEWRLPWRAVIITTLIAMLSCYAYSSLHTELTLKAILGLNAYITTSTAIMGWLFKLRVLHWLLGIKSVKPPEFKQVVEIEEE